MITVESLDKLANGLCLQFDNFQLANRQSFRLKIGAFYAELDFTFLGFALRVSPIGLPGRIMYRFDADGEEFDQNHPHFSPESVEKLKNLVERLRNKFDTQIKMLREKHDKIIAEQMQKIVPIDEIVDGVVRALAEQPSEQKT